MEHLPEDALKAFRRIQELTVLKNEPEDTLWDALYKIGDVAVEMLRQYDEFWKRAHQERIGAAMADEIERELLWKEMD